MAFTRYQPNRKIMAESEKNVSLELLMSDSRLVELCELQRVTDEILDVINLFENQHSDILAWILDPKEGHGQGDEILRDFLVAASKAAASEDCQLRRNGATAKFFAAWPPSRLRTVSFGSAFTARELGMKAAERVDLFVIDATNKFVLVIENKAGAIHNEEQLELYRDYFVEVRKGNRRLRDYDYALIALDREHTPDPADSLPAADQWLHMGYDWLKVSATRAMMHVERGNASARLVASYCQQQTDWTDKSEERCLALAAELHQAYPAEIHALLGKSGVRAEREWLTNGKAPESQLLFLLQNKSAVLWLKEAQGMATLRSAILGKLQHFRPDQVWYTRARLAICPTGWTQFETDSSWPVYFSIRYANATKTKYNLALCWDADCAPSESDATLLRELLTQVNEGFAKHHDSRSRRVWLGDNLNVGDVIERVSAWDVKLQSVLNARVLQSK